MNDYIKQLEQQNEELQKKLANMQLIQDVVQFTNSITGERLKISYEALQDLKFIHDIDPKEILHAYASEMIEEKLKKRSLDF